MRVERKGEQLTLSHTRGVEREDGVGILIRAYTTVQTSSGGTVAVFYRRRRKRETRRFSTGPIGVIGFPPLPPSSCDHRGSRRERKWSVWKGLEEEVWLVGSGAVMCRKKEDLTLSLSNLARSPYPPPLVPKMTFEGAIRKGGDWKVVVVALSRECPEPSERES